MKVSILQQAKLTGLALAVAAFSQQPITANAQTMTDVAVSEQAALVTAAADGLAQVKNANASSAQAQAKNDTRSASFVGGTGHDAAGGVSIVTEGGQRYLEFDSAFRTDSGPDLFVLLHREAVPTGYAESDYVSVGRLQRIEKTQRYLIPEGVDTADFGSVVIWCRQFNVTFGYATL